MRDREGRERGGRDNERVTEIERGAEKITKEKEHR